MSNDNKPENIRRAAEKLAERLASSEGKRALAEAAEASEASAGERLEAGRLDPKLLQKRVTL